MRIGYQAVRASYGGAKAEQERNELMFRWFARPLSFPIAWAALRLGLRPNDVTVVSLTVNIIGLSLIAAGGRAGMALGVVLLLAALALDAADGNMARATRNFSPVGEWLEGVGAYVLYGFFAFLTGVGAWRSAIAGDPVAAWPAGRETAEMVVLGAVASVTITLSILVTGKFFSVFKSFEKESVVARHGRGAYGMLFTLGRNLSFASGLNLPLTLVAVYLRRLDIVLAGYALLNSGACIAVVARCFWLSQRIGFPATASHRPSAGTPDEAK